MRSCLFFLALSVAALGLVLPVKAEPPERRTDFRPIYRLFNVNNSDHLYTSDRDEVEDFQTQGYDFESVVFLVAREQEPGMVPLYRFVQPNGVHMYSTSPRAGAASRAEKEMTVGYVATRPRPGFVPLYDFYKAQADLHFYTTDPRGEKAPQGGSENIGVVGFVKPVR